MAGSRDKPGHSKPQFAWDEVVGLLSWRAHARHPHLAVLNAAKGVDGGPEPVPRLVPGGHHDEERASPLRPDDGKSRLATPQADRLYLTAAASDAR
jgi:hypothetical protein